MTLRRILSSLILAAAACSPAFVEAQQIGQLPRTTPTTGLADSSLFLCSDSTKAVTRVCKFSDVQKRLAFKAFDSLLTGNIRADTIRANAGASKRLVLQTTTSGSAATTAMRFNEVQQSIITDGAIGRPGLTFGSDTSMGFWRAGTRDMRISEGANNIAQFIRNGAGLAGLRVGAGDGTHAAISFLAPDTTLGLSKFGTDTLALLTANATSMGIRGGASPTWFGGAGSLTIQAGTGNNRNLLLQTTNASGTPTTAFDMRAATLLIGPTGTVAAPGLAFNNCAACGISYSTGSGDMTFSVDGIAQLVLGHAGSSWTGSPGNMTITAGTGNSRTLALQGTGTTGTAISTEVVADSVVRFFLGRVGRPTLSFAAAQAGADTATGIYGSAGRINFAAQGVREFGVSTTGIEAYSAIGFQSGVNGTASGPALALSGTSAGMGFYSTAGADTLGIAVGSARQIGVLASGVLLLPLLPAEGATKNAMCWDAVTKNVTQNAAATCTVSSARYKENIQPLALDSAYAIVTRLTPVTFDYKADHKKSIHVIAEQADTISHRLTFYDSQGRPNSVDDGAILSAVLRVVQEQQRQVDRTRWLLYAAIFLGLFSSVTVVLSRRAE